MSGRALVTGGSAGLGRALANRLMDAGLTVVSVDRAEADVRDGAIRITCDLADRALVDAALPAIIAAGPFDLVFLNAGASATGGFETLPASTVGRLMTLNAETPMILAANLVRAGAVRGGMCFVSSLSHFTGYPGAAAYAASKDALAVYAKSVRMPFRKRGVTVTLACPGPLRTDHAARHAPPGADPQGRMDPCEAAAAIIEATRAGRRLVIPGTGPKLFAFAGRFIPRTVTRRMRKLVYEKLDRSVW